MISKPEWLWSSATDAAAADGDRWWQSFLPDCWSPICAAHLRQMIEHHTGAVEVAVTESADGQNAGAVAMAEIAEMWQLRTKLGA